LQSRPLPVDLWSSGRGTTSSFAPHSCSIRCEMNWLIFSRLAQLHQSIIYLTASPRMTGCWPPVSVTATIRSAITASSCLPTFLARGCTHHKCDLFHYQFRRTKHRRQLVPYCDPQGQRPSYTSARSDLRGAAKRTGANLDHHRARWRCTHRRRTCVDFRALDCPPLHTIDATRRTPLSLRSGTFPGQMPKPSASVPGREKSSRDCSAVQFLASIRNSTATILSRPSIVSSRAELIASSRR